MAKEVFGWVFFIGWGYKSDKCASERPWTIRFYGEHVLLHYSSCSKTLKSFLEDLKVFEKMYIPKVLDYLNVPRKGILESLKKMIESKMF